MGDHYGDNPELDRLDSIVGNTIDIESEQQKTNELLGQVLEELKKLNQALKPVQQVPFTVTQQQSGYRCMWCGAWIDSSVGPHGCLQTGRFT